MEWSLHYLATYFLGTIFIILFKSTQMHCDIGTIFAFQKINCRTYFGFLLLKII
jgi:hypothetical protein